MRKIANTRELQQKLEQLIAYSQSELPSRSRIASALSHLSRSLTAKANLTELELFTMNIMIKYKAFGRAGYLIKQGVKYSPEDPTIQSLAAKGYIKVSKNGSITPNYNKIVRELPLHPRPSIVHPYDDWPKPQDVMPSTSEIFTVGAIVVYTWGYDQTNVEFWEVSRVVNENTVEIRELEKKYVSRGEFMSAEVVAAPGRYTGAGARVRVQGDRLKMPHGSGKIWNGKPVTETSYA